MLIDLIRSRGNKRTITALLTGILGLAQYHPAVAPHVGTILTVLGLFGLGAVGQAAVSGTAVSPVDIDPRTLER